MSFEKHGRKVDELVKDLEEQVRPIVDKAREIITGFSEALKTADRKGFERAIELAAAEALRASSLDSCARIAEAIRKIPYTPAP